MTDGTSKMLLAAALFARGPRRPQNTTILKVGKPCRIGAFTVTAFNVDHSAFDAAAFLIEAGGKRIFYTGDFRLHGRKPGMAKVILRDLARPPVDLLITEGTYAGRSCEQDGLSEEGLEVEATKRIGAARGLVLVQFSPLNVDRIVTFLRAARASKRVFVADAYTAYVMHLIHRQVSVPTPWTSRHIRVFRPRSQRATRGGAGTRAFFERLPTVEILHPEICGNPNNYVMVFRPRMLADDFGDSLPPDSVNIFSYWRGYLDDPPTAASRRRLEALGAKSVSLHASGHARESDLFEFAKALGPKAVLPVHTTQPKVFRSLPYEVLPAQDGEDVYV